MVTSFRIPLTFAGKSVQSDSKLDKSKKIEAERLTGETLATGTAPGLLKTPVSICGRVEFPDYLLDSPAHRATRYTLITLLKVSVKFAGDDSWPC